MEPPHPRPQVAPPPAWTWMAATDAGAPPRVRAGRQVRARLAQALSHAPTRTRVRVVQPRVGVAIHIPHGHACVLHTHLRILRYHSSTTIRRTTTRSATLPAQHTRE